MGSMMLFWLLLLAVETWQQCKVYVCMSKNDQPAGQQTSTFCLHEQTSLGYTYRVNAYVDMCPCISTSLISLATQYCSYNSIVSEVTKAETIYSVCRNKTAAALIYTPPASLPGEACDTYGAVYSCPYGQKL